MRLEGKIAFISGGARGMGAVEARLFASEGAAVGIGDTLEDEGRAVASEINESGGQCLFAPLDVTSEVDWQKAIADTVSAFGRLDILVNNAGVSQWSLLHETSEADWDRVMDINTKGVFLGTKHAIPAMKEAGGGSIINISSQLGSRGDGTVQSAVPGVEGRGQAAYEAHGDAVRARRDTVQLGSSGADKHRHDRAASRRPGSLCQDAVQNPDRTLWRTHRDSEWCAVLGVG